MVRYTLRQIAYFRAVAEQGGIAQAARVLNIAQPSIAQALAKLEQALGLTLFERHHARGLTLTLQGRSFLGHATALALAAEQVEREARALAAETTGEIRLGVFWTLAPFYAADLMRDFARQSPGVVIRQKEMALTRLPKHCAAARSTSRSPMIAAPISPTFPGSNSPRSNPAWWWRPTTGWRGAARSPGTSWRTNPM